MKWNEIQIHTIPEAIEPISILLDELRTSGSWIEENNQEVIIKCYLSSLESLDQYMHKLERNISELHIPYKLQVHEVDEESWADEWKKYYEPTRITEQFTVKPLWTEYEAEENEKLIHLDPGMAFGTGTHPSTILAIQLMEKHLLSNCTVLDVGCGSGILSIAAAKLGAKKVQAIDIDPVALEKTKENVAHNQVVDQIHIKQGDLLAGIEEKYDVVIANILAEVILKMANDLPKVCESEGIFICSGIIKEKASHVNEALSAFQILEEITMDDWVAMALKRC